MKLADRMSQSIRLRADSMVLRTELAQLGGVSQVSEALRTLQRDGELRCLGAGANCKASRDGYTHEVTPVVDIETLRCEVARKLNAHETEGTLPLDTGDRRVTLKLTLDKSSVQYVNNRNSRAFEKKRLNTATFPTTDVGNYVSWLAGLHGVRYVPTAVDQWAETVTRLAGDEVRSGAVQDLLVALKRAGKLTKDDMARLLVNYLRERKQGV